MLTCIGAMVVGGPKHIGYFYMRLPELINLNSVSLFLADELSLNRVYWNSGRKSKTSFEVDPIQISHPLTSPLEVKQGNSRGPGKRGPLSSLTARRTRSTRQREATKRQQNIRYTETLIQLDTMAARNTLRRSLLYGIPAHVVLAVSPRFNPERPQHQELIVSHPTSPRLLATFSQ